MSVPTPLSGRIALITGASRGLGAAVAVRLAAAGAHVVLVARTVGGLEEVDDRIRAAGGTATLVPHDLTDLTKIDVLARSLYERFKRLDILVGNAGMLGHYGPVAQFDPKIWDRVMMLNLTVNHRLILALDPLLRASDAGRAIFVTDTLASSVSPFGGAYAVSKAALEMMVRLYAAEVARAPLKINLVDPGAVRTKMRAHGFPGEDPQSVRPPEDITDIFVELASPDCTRHGEVVRV